jgi:hypothetical protein
MKRLFVVPVVALLWLAGANLSRAGTITYTFTGTGTGDLGGVLFTSALFTITEVANPSQISSCGIGCFTVNDLLSTIAVAGFPLARVRTPVRVFDNQTLDALGYSRSIGSDDLMDLRDSAFGTYNLATAFGPIFVAVPFSVNQFNRIDGCITTSQGDVAFSSIVDITFTALTRANVQSPLVRGVDPVPEPATIALFGLGCFGAGLLWRLRRNKLPTQFWARTSLTDQRTEIM